jgi:hypothetical protein
VLGSLPAATIKLYIATHDLISLLFFVLGGCGPKARHGFTNAWVPQTGYDCETSLTQYAHVGFCSSLLQASRLWLAEQVRYLLLPV